MHIRGTFDVKLTPLPGDDTTGGDAIGRMALDKQFHGDLEAQSYGQMIAHRSATPGSAGYVAMEQVKGTLGGKQGSFVLQHSATMSRGASSLTRCGLENAIHGAALADRSFLQGVASGRSVLGAVWVCADLRPSVALGRTLVE